MDIEKIQVNVTETGQVMDVTVLKKSVNQIEVVVGEGAHSVKCVLTPTANNMAYVGNVMGREIVYKRTAYQVEEDVELADSAHRPLKQVR